MELSEKGKCQVRPRIVSQESGQGLLETALIVPFLVLLMAFAVDYGYFFIVAANLTSASHNAAEYSIQGFESPGQIALPDAGPLSDNSSISSLAVGDLSGLIAASTTSTVQVCSKGIGVSQQNLTECSSFGPTGNSYVPALDPEAPTFLLNRVDVTYTVHPPIPMTFFSHSIIPSLSFHRQVSMRVLD
jgi:Flp pilus assembly protein TadG